MAVTVQLDSVPGGDDLGDQRWAAGDLLAGEKEGRRRPRLAQDLKYPGRPLRVGAVIKGERDARLGGLAVRDTKQRPDAGNDRGKGGTPTRQHPHREAGGAERADQRLRERTAT